MRLKTCGAGRLSMLIAMSRDRFHGIDPGIRGKLLRGKLLCASSPLEDVHNGCTARCGGDLHKSAKHRMAKRIAAHRPLCKVRHLKFTSDIIRGMRSRAQRRGSCDGLGERRIDDLARKGIRRHLRWRASAVSRGNAEKQASGRKASRRH